MTAIKKIPRVAFSVTNCICFDQRVLKMAKSVSSLGFGILIIGRITDDCINGEPIPFTVKRFRMLFKRSFFFYAFFNIRLFFFLMFSRVDVLVANDLDTLLPNYLVSKLKHLPLVYDSHEYFTGVPELNKRPFVKSVWKYIEKNIFPRLENVITVSESIADLYETEYHHRPHVVRNLSELPADLLPFNREDLDIEVNSFVVILQGGGINIDKGAEELVKAVCMTQDVVLIFAGSGDVLPVLKKMVRGMEIGDKVRFLPKMPWNRLIRYTMMADAGMCLEKDTNQNYRYSLPNKLFDYIAAGIPVISGDLPEIKKIVSEYECGLVLHSITPEDISKAIVTFRDDPQLKARLAGNSARAAEKLNWNVESEKVKSIYTKFKPS
jgi:glycosyltransferase involved in cell wall biosynthesis